MSSHESGLPVGPLDIPDPSGCYCPDDGEECGGRCVSAPERWASESNLPHMQPRCSMCNRLEITGDTGIVMGDDGSWKHVVCPECPRCAGKSNLQESLSCRHCGGTLVCAVCHAEHADSTEKPVPESPFPSTQSRETVVGLVRSYIPAYQAEAIVATIERWHDRRKAAEAERDEYRRVADHWQEFGQSAEAARAAAMAERDVLRAALERIAYAPMPQLRCQDECVMIAAEALSRV